MILFHGTGARRRQSIEDRGLLPKLGSYVFASKNSIIASIFAAARAEKEDDWGLVVSFETDERDWEIDPQFPESYRTKKSVSGPLSFHILNPEAEIEAYEELKRIAKELQIRIE